MSTSQQARSASSYSEHEQLRFYDTVFSSMYSSDEKAQMRLDSSLREKTYKILLEKNLLPQESFSEHNKCNFLVFLLPKKTKEALLEATQENRMLKSNRAPEIVFKAASENDETTAKLINLYTRRKINLDVLKANCIALFDGKEVAVLNDESDTALEPIQKKQARVKSNLGEFEEPDDDGPNKESEPMDTTTAMASVACETPGISRENGEDVSTIMKRLIIRNAEEVTQLPGTGDIPPGILACLFVAEKTASAEWNQQIDEMMERVDINYAIAHFSPETATRVIQRSEKMNWKVGFASVNGNAVGVKKSTWLLILFGPNILVSRTIYEYSSVQRVFLEFMGLEKRKKFLNGKEKLYQLKF